MEPLASGALDPELQPRNLDPAARADIRMGAGGGPREPRGSRRSGDLHAESSEPLRRTRGVDGVAVALAFSRCDRHVERVLQGALPTRAPFVPRILYEQPELL